MGSAPSTEAGDGQNALVEANFKEEQLEMLYKYAADNYPEVSPRPSEETDAFGKRTEVLKSLEAVNRSKLSNRASVDEIISAAIVTLSLGAKKPDESDEDDAHMNTDLQSMCSVSMLSAFPAQVLEKKLLMKLVLKGNDLSAGIPEEISALQDLRVLDVSECGISSLPAGVCLLPKLEVLIASENAIESLPADINKLQSLTTLTMYKNKLASVPDCIGVLSNLEEINFFNNKLKKLPKTMSGLENLTMLNVGCNKLMTLPSTSRWVNLEELSASFNNIVMLGEFSGMKSLKKLQLNKNALESIPDDAFEASSELDILNLSSLRLTKCPSSIGKCGALKQLNLSSNMITELISFAGCTSLEILNVSSNKLSTLDIVEFGSLSNLKTLMAGDNASVSSIPSSITSCKNLSRLLMRGCSLTDECKSGLKAVEEQCNAKKGRFMI